MNSPPTIFWYVHISDFHFCLQPSRLNALSLIKRDLRSTLDTLGSGARRLNEQRKQLGLMSIARPASHVESIIAGVAQFCYRHKDAVDGIIVSGDLATTALTADIGPARAFVMEPAARGYRTDTRRPTLSAAERPIYVVPGNHDRYATNTGATNSRNFDFAFADHLRNFDGHVGHWIRRKGGRYLGFVYADFTLRTRKDASQLHYSLGQGRVYSDVLDSLKKRTLDLRARYPGIIFVWVIHFAPYDCESTSLQLLDWPHISAAAVALGVVATLCGHTHQQTKVEIPGHTVYCAGSAGCADSEDHSTAHLIRIEISDSGVSLERQNYLWNADDLTFRRTAND